MAHKISIASIREILEEYDPKNLKEDESLLDDANTVAILCEIAASTEVFVTPSQQRQLLDLLWHSPFDIGAGSRHPFLIGKLGSLMFHNEAYGISYLKDKKLKVDIHELYEATSFIHYVNRIMARLHVKHNNKNSNILFTNENYEKILTALKNSSGDLSFLRSLYALCQLLKSVNLMNQSNLDLILDNSHTLNDDLDAFITNFDYFDYSNGGFTPHILNFMLKELHNHDPHQSQLSTILLRFLHTSHKRNGSAPINSRFDYIVKHYQKIPNGIYPILQNIPRHLLSMNFFRQLIKIADKNITQAQKVLEMTAAITTLINSDAPGRRATPHTINYGQSVHNSDVEKSVAESTFKLQAAYPDVYSGEMLESKLNELRQFATSLKTTTTEKFAQAAILRIINNPHDHQLLRAGMTNKQALVLVWAALHDETKYLPGVTLEDAKKSFINSLIGIERAYNIDENDRDNGTTSLESCPSGTFNMIINALNTIHHDVDIAFNSKELAGLRLKAIIIDEIKKYLEKYPELSTEIKDDTIDNIEELNANIVKAFGENPDNALFFDVLACLPTLSINSVLQNNSKPVTNPQSPQDVLDVPVNNTDGRIKRLFKKIRDSFQQRFASVTFNPFKRLMYNDQNEDTFDHPLPHTRTLHRSLWQKMGDTHDFLLGSNITSLIYQSDLDFGLLDYLTSLGILKMIEIFLHHEAKKSPNSKIKYAAFIVTAINMTIKSCVIGAFTIAVFPLVVLIHLAGKIALAIETRNANNIPIKNNLTNTTTTLKQQFKQNHLPEFSRTSAISTNVATHAPIKLERKVLFSANYSKDYVTADFSLANRKDIDRARSMARVRRDTCHEFHNANLLSYKRVAKATATNSSSSKRARA